MPLSACCLWWSTCSRLARSRPQSRSRNRAGAVLAGGGIELEINGVVVRASRGGEAKTVAAVIQALQGSQ